MDKMPRNRENLYYYNPYEQKVFATLKQINWGPPKSPSFIPNDTTPKSDSRSARSPTPSHGAWLKGATSASRLETVPSTSEKRSIALSPDTFASKDFPPISVHVHHCSSKHNVSDNGWHDDWSAESPSIHYNEDSDYSDDLYGTGRPLRPSLINSDQRIQEWQLSAQGNPKVTVFLEDTFQPDSHEEICVSNRELTDFLENDFVGSVTSKYVKQPPSINQVDENSSVFDDLALLITVDEPTETSIVVDAEEASPGNSTIVEDSSILAGLDPGFTEGMEPTSAGLDYRCLSDDGTEIDSELDKIEYEFQPVQPLSMDEMKILSSEMEKTCTENGNVEFNAVDIKENLNASSHSDTTLVEVVCEEHEIMGNESTEGELQTEMTEDIFEPPKYSAGGRKA